MVVAVVFVGSGGNDAGATTDLEVASTLAGTLDIAGTEIFRFGAGLLSITLGIVWPD
jgi:hypothetical protein